MLKLIFTSDYNWPFYSLCIPLVRFPFSISELIPFYNSVQCQLEYMTTDENGYLLTRCVVIGCQLLSEGDLRSTH